ncbi:MAG: glycosyltransferase involved in cell wall biosynthesis [Planctomycetota bacterium]|jgi:glycosyltransferase involved in cell wall biosynthesis
MKLSIVMPIYNEENTLEQIVERVLATPFEKELLLVDDGSVDRSREIMGRLEAAHPEIRCFYHEVNSGKGSALSTGFKQVEGDLVVVQDADLEYDPNDYGALIEPIQVGRADVVYGSRFLGRDGERVHFFWHTLGNRLLTGLSNLLTGLKLTDMETCYKVFRSDVARDLDIRSRTFAVEPEMTAKFARRELRVVEVPISYEGRNYNTGKKIGIKDAFIAVWAIVRWRFAG